MQAGQFITQENLRHKPYFYHYRISKMFDIRLKKTMKQK